MFGVRGEAVEVLKTPQDFYRALHEGIGTAKRRIVMASLYLGTGDMESELVDALRQAVRRSLASPDPRLHIHLLLDATRGSRGFPNSVSMLLPLLDELPSPLRVSLYHTPSLRGLLRLLLPEKLNEAVGLQHMKLYVTDDTVIVSGANLSESYFTSRQDRYVRVRSAALCDFCCDLVSCVGDSSLQLAHTATPGETRTRGDSDTGETRRGDTPGETRTRGDSDTGETRRGATPGETRTRGDSDTGETRRGDTPGETRTRGDSDTGETRRGDTPGETRTRGDSDTGETRRGDTPGETRRDTPGETRRGDTPGETRRDTPGETRRDTPGETRRGDTPGETRRDTPGETRRDTPGETRRGDTPGETRRDTPGETRRDTPGETRRGDTVGRFSWRGADVQRLLKPPPVGPHPYLGDKAEFVESARSRILGVVKTHRDRASAVSPTQDVDTWIFPLIQMGQLGVDIDEKCTLRLLSARPHGSRLTLATGYLNVPDSLSARLTLATGYLNLSPRVSVCLCVSMCLSVSLCVSLSLCLSQCTLRLLTTRPHGCRLTLATGYLNVPDSLSACLLGCRGEVTVLAASPEANGFYGASGVLGAVPHAYSLIASRFFERLHCGVAEAAMFEYKRPGWTFHAKGLWVTLPHHDAPSLSLVGSTNFGRRSAERDLEAQLCIATTSPSLRQQLRH
ncbi:CDP-diacylglycerol--glycerol-3-phosphate 3-phosphatidyltransferase, mitochondrial, partial [Lampetra fluviatilis]